MYCVFIAVHFIWCGYHVFNIFSNVGWDSSVSVTTRYRLDGPGNESQWGVRVSEPVQSGPGAHPASCTMGIKLFLGVKQPVRGIDRPPSSSAEVKERVGLYLHSPSGPSWPLLG